MARSNGKAVLIRFGTPSPVTVVLQTECTITITRDPIEVSTKDDDFAVYVAGTANWTVSGSVVLDDDQTTHDDRFDDINGSTEQDLALQTAGHTYSGKAFCSNWSVEGASDGPQTLSFDYQGSGAAAKT